MKIGTGVLLYHDAPGMTQTVMRPLVGNPSAGDGAGITVIIRGYNHARRRYDENNFEHLWHFAHSGGRHVFPAGHQRPAR